MAVDGELNAAIRRIARITSAMKPVVHPGAGPRAPAAFAMTPEEQCAMFSKRLDELRAPGDNEPGVIRTHHQKETIEAIRSLCEGIAPADTRWQDDSEKPPREWKIGITPAWSLVAESGSVLVEIPNAASAWASLLVDRHIVIASMDQLVPDIAGLYLAIAERETAVQSSTGASQNLVCITGCSRTADIEKLLVIPAHGPRQVRVILSDEPFAWDVPRSTACPKEPIAQAIDDAASS